MTDDYERLERESRKPSTVRDHTDQWAQLSLIGGVNGDAGGDVAAFCERKHITLDALAQLGARYAVRRDLRCVAFAGVNDAGRVTAIKYRPLAGTSHDSHAEPGSVWLRPIVIGSPSSLDWLVAEGETDAARLYDLVGDRCAILAMPAGARTFKPEWAEIIPRGARVGLCLDADADGDEGAERATRVIGGRTFRVRPTDQAGDWCDWNGDQAAFLELVKGAQAVERYQFDTYADFTAREFPAADPLLGKPGSIFLAAGSLLMAYGADGCGKSTWTIDGVVHLAAGVDWLGIPVPRPVRTCVIENEGPPGLFQEKLRNRIAGWEGPDPTPNLFMFAGPWGEFSFADANARAALCSFCDEHDIDVVAANPTLGLGVATSGKPDDTQQFVDWLTECGLKTRRAFWLLHHENKAGQISGDWGRHPDTKVFLQRDGNAQRTKLDWAKTRWATLDPKDKTVMLEWVTEDQSYTVVEMDTVGASDDELRARVREYVKAHPCASTRSIQEGVKGTNSRIKHVLETGEYDSVKGPRNADLWFASGDRDRDGSDADDAVT
jgi:AAA domain